jgi:hypothetical protein
MSRQVYCYLENLLARRPEKLQAVASKFLDSPPNGKTTDCPVHPSFYRLGLGSMVVNSAALRKLITRESSELRFGSG